MRFAAVFLCILGLCSQAFAQKPTKPAANKTKPTLPEAALRAQATLVTERALTVLDSLRAVFQETYKAQENADAQWEIVRQDTTATTADKKSAQKAKSEASKTVAQVQKHLKNAEKNAENAQKLASLDSAQLARALPPLSKKILPTPASKPLPKEDSAAKQAGSEKRKSPKKEKDPKPNEAAHAPEKETKKKAMAQENPPTDSTKTSKSAKNSIPKPPPPLVRTPPVPACVLTQDRRDPFSGERYRETAAAELFRTSPAVLKRVLNGQPHIRCEAALGSGATTATLILTFRINDPNGRKAFGTLAQGSFLGMQFIDGTTVQLLNQANDEGSWDKEGKILTYQGRYLVDKGTWRKLQKTPLDRLRVAWSAGYEDYSVYIVDLLQQQAACLGL